MIAVFFFLFKNKETNDNLEEQIAENLNFGMDA